MRARPSRSHHACSVTDAAILQEGTGLTAGQLYGLPATAAGLPQAAIFAGSGADWAEAGDQFAISRSTSRAMTHWSGSK